MLIEQIILFWNNEGRLPTGTNPYQESQQLSVFRLLWPSSSLSHRL